MPPPAPALILHQACRGPARALLWPPSLLRPACRRPARVLRALRVYDSYRPRSGPHHFCRRPHARCPAPACRRCLRFGPHALTPCASVRARPSPARLCAPRAVSAAAPKPLRSVSFTSRRSLPRASRPSRLVVPSAPGPLASFAPCASVTAPSAPARAPSYRRPRPRDPAPVYRARPALLCLRPSRAPAPPSGPSRPSCPARLRLCRPRPARASFAPLRVCDQAVRARPAFPRAPPPPPSLLRLPAPGQGVCCCFRAAPRPGSERPGPCPPHSCAGFSGRTFSGCRPHPWALSLRLRRPVPVRSVLPPKLRPVSIPQEPAAAACLRPCTTGGRRTGACVRSRCVPRSQQHPL